MAIRRIHIALPEDLVKEIDSIVGSRGRNAFLVETTGNEVRRRQNV
jgi:metal-responsive CopG/Arc/MetJ family transcriptional regulator